MSSIAIGTIMPFAGNCNQAAVAANALLCLVTPLKLTTFDPGVAADAGQARGVIGRE